MAHIQMPPKLKPDPESECYHTLSGQYVVKHYCAHETPHDIKVFRDWALRKGFTMRQTYPHHYSTAGKRFGGESIKRAFTLELGPWSALCLNRITRPRSQQNPKGHNRQDNSLLTECTISLFFNHLNLGAKRITWREFMAQF